MSGSACRVILGAMSHLDNESRNQVVVESMSEEAVTSSEIEGEILNRESVQSSIRRELGLSADDRRASPAEQGIAEMMVGLYGSYARELDAETMCSWHGMLLRGRRDLNDVGRYRTHEEPMQVVSGTVYEPMVHFEAPPSTDVPREMAAFLQWFNHTAPGSSAALPALTRAGVAHVYFESIHPFEDGNGRIGRAISEKALAQGLPGPTHPALAATILAHRSAYYDALAASNKRNEISDWLAWFGGIALEAQQRTRYHLTIPPRPVSPITIDEEGNVVVAQERTSESLGVEHLDAGDGARWARCRTQRTPQ